MNMILINTVEGAKKFDLDHLIRLAWHLKRPWRKPRLTLALGEGLAKPDWIYDGNYT